MIIIVMGMMVTILKTMMIIIIMMGVIFPRCGKLCWNWTQTTLMRGLVWEKGKGLMVVIQPWLWWWLDILPFCRLVEQKEKGNAAFKAGNYGEALEHYTHVSCSSQFRWVFTRCCSPGRLSPLTQHTRQYGPNFSTTGPLFIQSNLSISHCQWHIFSTTRPFLHLTSKVAWSTIYLLVVSL